MLFFFEYGNWLPVIDKPGLKQLLINIWREQYLIYENAVRTDENSDDGYQPFLQFDENRVRAKNYIGFIQNGNQLIEIYPKVFRDVNCQDKGLMLRHIFYWFSYCRKWRFPFNKASLDTQDIKKFPELIIYLIANQFHELLSRQALLQYQFMEERLESPKGRINFSRYITNSLGRGQDHKIECDHEPCLYDNKVNRILKYCTRLLLTATTYSENIDLLQKTLFILDEVEDIPCTVVDIDSVSLNSFHSEYLSLLESSKLVIRQLLYSHSDYDISQWSLLFPMEYIFEDFVAGFMEKHISADWHVKYQKSDEYLSNTPVAFNMQHDIFLTAKNGSGRKIIVDTKYKLRSKCFKDDIKKEIAQSDLYQVVSYAYKRGCNEVLLLYPNISESLYDHDNFEIVSGFESKNIIKVTAMEIPFWSIEKFDAIESRLKESFIKLLG